MKMNNDIRVKIDETTPDVVFYSFGEDIPENIKNSIRDTVKDAPMCIVFWLNETTEDMAKLCAHTVDNCMTLYSNYKFYIMVDDNVMRDDYAIAGITISKNNYNIPEFYKTSDKNHSINHRTIRIPVSTKNIYGEVYCASPEDIIEQINNVTANGGKHISIAGIDMYDYSCKNVSFENLYQQIQSLCKGLDTIHFDYWPSTINNLQYIIDVASKDENFVKYAAIDCTSLFGQCFKNIQDPSAVYTFRELADVLSQNNVIFQCELYHDLSCVADDDFNALLEVLLSSNVHRVLALSSKGVNDYCELKDKNIHDERTSILRKAMRDKINQEIENIHPKNIGEQMAYDLLVDAYEEPTPDDED